MGSDPMTNNGAITEAMTKPHVAGAHEVETYSGLYVDCFAPRPATIRLEDIAHALAHTCRFGGHCRTFCSVAEHAVHVAFKLLNQGCNDFALAGLHHDDAEAYLGDVPRPLKPLLGDAYRKLTDAMDSAISVALGGLWDPIDFGSPEVLRADEWALRGEAMALLPSRGEGWRFHDTWDVDVVPTLGLQPVDAKRLFLRTHERLVTEPW